jgi:Methyltransferase FkbM domain
LIKRQHRTWTQNGAFRKRENERFMIITSQLIALGHRPRGIVHVGAHAGEEMSDYLALRPQLIVWIEADPTTFKLLERGVAVHNRLIKRRALLNRFRNFFGKLTVAPESVRQVCLNALVGESDGTVFPFHRFSNRGDSSSIFAATPLLQKTWPHVVETGEVLSLVSRRLDSLLFAVGVAPGDIDVLVFDIQGAELMALKGAGPFLKAARFVEVEVSQEPIYDGAPLAPNLDSFLNGCGFERLSDLPWHGDAVYRQR